MEVEISGIKCDKPHCNWRDDSVKFEEYPSYLNRPCPVCGSNLLKQEDYNRTLATYKIVRVLDKIETAILMLNPINWFRKKQNKFSYDVKYENDGAKTKTLTKNK